MSCEITICNITADVAREQLPNLQSVVITHDYNMETQTGRGTAKFLGNTTHRHGALWEFESPTGTTDMQAGKLAKLTYK